MHRELQFEFNLKGLDIDKVSDKDLESNADDLRKVVAEYDATRSLLAEKIDNLYGLLQSRPVENVSAEDITAKEHQLAVLRGRQEQLQEERKLQLENYVAASTARMKVTAAAAEARTLTTLRATIDHNDLIGLLIRDKINAILTVATQYLNAFVEGGYTLAESNRKVVVRHDDKTFDYDELSQEVKTAVYVSLLLSLPNSDESDGRWIVFEERINIDKDVLADMLLNIANLSYVISVKKEKPEAKTAAAE